MSSVTAPADPFAGLRDRDYAREGLFVCEGRLVIEKALAAGHTLTTLICMPADEAHWQEISGGAWPVRSLPRAEMEALVGFPFHRGAIALARRPLPQVPDRAEGPGLVLWNVTDPDNLGALIRSAAALGARAVYLGPGSADPLGRKALRASMGCALSLPVLTLSGLGSLIALRRPGLSIAAAALVGGAVSADALGRREPRGDWLLVLGNEGWGLPPEVVSSCDTAVVIPMASGIDSLNVAAAGAILMWELFRTP